MGVGLSVGEAREAVKPVAAHTASCLRVGLVQVDPDREVERPMPSLFEVVRKLLDAWLVRYRRIWEQPRPRRLGWVLACLPVHKVELLRLCVIRLKILIRD